MLRCVNFLCGCTGQKRLKKDNLTLGKELEEAGFVKPKTILNYSREILLLECCLREKNKVVTFPLASSPYIVGLFTSTFRISLLCPCHVPGTVSQLHMKDGGIANNETNMYPALT